MKKKSTYYKWTFEIQIAAVWVADGCNLDAEAVHDALTAHTLGWADQHEVRVRMVKQPSQSAVAKEMGAKTIARMHQLAGKPKKVA